MDGKNPRLIRAKNVTMSPVEERDELLIERSLAGDEQAFRELYNRYSQEVLGYIRRRMPAKLSRRVSGADLLQETYATAF